MPRRRSLPPPAEISPTALYSRAQAAELLGLRPSSLSRAIREHGLRVSRRGGKYYFLGAWLLQWIAAGECPSRGGTDGLQSPTSPVPGRAEG